MTGVCSAEVVERSVLAESPFGMRNDELVMFVVVDMDEQLAAELFKLFTELLSEDDDTLLLFKLLVFEVDVDVAAAE